MYYYVLLFQFNILIPAVFLLMLLVAIIVPLINKPRQSLAGFAFVFGTAVPVYYIFIQYRWKPKALVKYSSKLIFLITFI